MPNIIRVLFALLTVNAAWIPAAAGARFTVAPDGSDAADGSPGRPFATLGRARDAVREALRRGEAAEVVLRGGTYELAAPLDFGPQDSGGNGNPVVWRAADGEEVRVSGGRCVEGWRSVSDPAVRAKFDPGVRERVLELDLKARGISDYGDMSGGFGKSGSTGLEVFIDDAPTTLARYPNEGFIELTEALGATLADIRGTKGTKEGVFRVSDPRVVRWVGEKDPRVMGYWFWDWADERQKISSIDPATRVVTLVKPWHEYGYRKGQYFYGYNLLCEIDRPGEWYLDRETGRLYLLPSDDRPPRRTLVSLLPSILSLRGASHITFRGLLLEGARGSAFVANDCEDVRLEGSTVWNCGGWAARVSGGKNCAVLGCEINGMGCGGVLLEGGDRRTLAPAGHRVENCDIHHYSRWTRTYQPGIGLQGVGCIAAHNLIHDAPHQAIAFGGNDHVIEFNEIHDVCEETNDAGAIYAWNDWAARGHRIRHNFLHHIRGRGGKGASGVYLDDGFSSAAVFGNVFQSVSLAVLIGGGRDISLENNLFVDCEQAMTIDARGLDWRAFGFDELREKLERWPYKTPPWSERYPQLAVLLDDHPMAPVGDAVRNNIMVSSAWGRIYDNAKPYVTVEKNWPDAPRDLLAGDPPAVPHVKKAGGKAGAPGFEPIPWDKIGLREKPGARGLEGKIGARGR